MLVVLWCDIEILIQRFKNSIKMSKILKSGIFVIFVLGLHGNGQQVNRCLSICFVTMTYCLYDMGVNYIEYGKSIFKKK